MATRFSIEAVFRAIDQMTAPIKKMTLQNKKFTRAIKTDFARAQRSVQNFGRSFKQNLGNGIRIGAGLAVVGIGMVIKEGLALASDLIEVQNVIDQTFGDGADKINKWSKTTLDAFGLSELQAKEFTGTMGAMIKSSGISGDSMSEMAMKITELSGDVASFRNLKPEDVFEKMQSIVTGTTKPLRALGINMTVANLEAFALTKGIKKSWKEMSQAEQVALRYNFVLEKTVDMQGDFKRTSKEFANQQRLLTVNFQQFAAAVVSKVLPMFNKLITFANSFIKSLDAEKLGNRLKLVFTIIAKGVNIFIKLFKILKPFIPFILGIIIAWQAYQKALMIAAIAQAAFNLVMSLNPLGIIIISIGLLIGLIFLLVKNWDVVKAAIIKGTMAVIDWFKRLGVKIVELWDKFKGLALVVAAPFVIWVEILRSVLEHWNDIKKAFTEGGFLAGIMAIGKAILSGILAPVQSLLELISKIPGLEDIAKGGAAKIAGLRESLFDNESDNGPITPSERSSLIREESVSRGEVTIKDETGKAEMNNAPKGKNFNLKLQSSGGF